MEDYAEDWHLLEGDRQKSPLPAISVIITATEVGASWILPCAYYYATAPFPASTLVSLQQGDTHPHVQKCLLARERLIRAKISVNRFLSLPSAPGCIAAFDGCETIRSGKLSELLRSIARGRNADPPRSTAKQLDSLRELAICSECFKQAETQQQRFAARFWEELPDIFGLPPWDELDVMKRTAMGQDTDEADGGA
ncbi:hypothetical protein C8R46DRAFT_980842 [Mycena filopes]|nr:hypothetical protein C8R46DRAFT_980842 [Mycena filopes]